VSLRRQFVLVFVAFSVVVSALGGGLAYFTARRALEQELDTRAAQVAGTAADVGFQADLVLALRPGDETEALGYYRSYQEKLRRLGRFRYEAHIVKTDLSVLVTTRPVEELAIGDFFGELDPYREEILAAERLGTAVSPLFFVGDRPFKYGFARLEQTNAILAVLLPADYMDPLYAFRRNVIWGSILAAIVAAFLAWFLATTVTVPLNRLGRVALRIQRGRMDEPVREERGGELGRLSRAMERMREGILHRDEQLRLMLAQVAHEIRNPLGGLELFASAAAAAEEAEERDRLIGKLRSEITALNRIIDDFLTFARPLRADQGLHDVRTPIREAVELVEAEMRRSDEELVLDLPSQPLLAKADPEHVKRVMLNLVRNAAQAGERVVVRCEPFRGEVMISVKDDGPGVPREMRGRLFEPFVTDKEKGAGLGLAIVRRVVEANQGRVEFVRPTDSGGEGAEFKVYFRGGEDLSPEEVGV